MTSGIHLPALVGIGAWVGFVLLCLCGKPLVVSCTDCKNHYERKECEMVELSIPDIQVMVKP